MPSLTIKQQKVGRYYVSLEATESHYLPIYKVALCENIGGLYSTLNEQTYGTANVHLAKATFNRYCRKAKALTV